VDEHPEAVSVSPTAAQSASRDLGIAIDLPLNFYGEYDNVVANQSLE
jgi:hypothetical protein